MNFWLQAALITAASAILCECVAEVGHNSSSVGQLDCQLLRQTVLKADIYIMHHQVESLLTRPAVSYSSY